MSDKQFAIESIERLPEDASLEAIARHIKFIAGVRKGLDEIKKSKTIPHEEVKQEIRGFFRSWP